MRSLLLIASALSALVTAPSVADACSAPQCWPGVITPNNATSVPANLPGIYWRPLNGYDSSGTTSDPQNVILATAAAPDTPLAFTTTPLPDGAFLIVPTEPLMPSTTYLVTDNNTCGGGTLTGPSASFVTSAEATSPTALGMISVSSEAVETISVSTSSGSCTSEVLAHRVTITPSLIFEATPWSDVFHFEVLVDGQVWSRSTSINTSPDVRGTWQLYRTCSSMDPGADPGLSAGPHTVSLRASIPGEAGFLTTPEITVDMHCPDGPGNLGDDIEEGGCQSTRSGATSGLIALILGALVLGRRRKTR